MVGVRAEDLRPGDVAAFSGREYVIQDVLTPDDKRFYEYVGSRSSFDVVVLYGGDDFERMHAYDLVPIRLS